MIGEDLLEILRCPQDKSRLHLADTELLDRLNQAIASGQVTNQSGTQVSEPLAGGLVREDNRVLYPIIDDLPVLLIDESIPLDSL